MLALKSDRAALILTIPIAAIELAILLINGVYLDPIWLFCILYAAICFTLFHALRPIGDVITGKDYIRVFTRYDVTRKTYKSSRIAYAFGLVFAVFTVVFVMSLVFIIYNSFAW